MNEAIRKVTERKEKGAIASKSRRRQTTSSHASVDADPSTSDTRRKVAEIRRDTSETKVDHGLNESEGSSGKHDREMQVARTEPCSPALSALVMAAARRGASGREQGPPQAQDEFFSAMTWVPSSIPREPRLPYPLVSSIWPTLPSRSQSEGVPAHVQTIEGLLSQSTRPQSPLPRPPRPRPQSLQMAYSSSPHSPLSIASSAPSTVSPPPSTNSTSFTPPSPSIPARTMSWAPYPTAPLVEQAAPGYALNPEPPVQHLQAPSQQGYFMHFSDSNRGSNL